MFSRRRWISTFLLANDWTPNATDLSHTGNLWANVTTKLWIKLVSCIQGSANIRTGPFSSFLTVFHCVGFLHKVHIVRPRKSEFTTSQAQIKQRKLAFLKVQRKFFKSSPRWPWAFWYWPYSHSRVNYLWQREGRLWRKGSEGSSQDQKWGKSEACVKLRVLLSQGQLDPRKYSGIVRGSWPRLGELINASWWTLIWHLNDK